MPLEKLKQHAQSQLESLASKKAELLKKLDERGVLRSGWSIVPDLAEVESREIDWNAVSDVISVTEEARGDLMDFVIRLDKWITHEKKQHCFYVALPASSNAISNYIEAMQLAHKPKRWELFQSVTEMAKREIN